MPRCPECNHKAPAHSSHCRAGIDESRPMTSAARYHGLPLPGHEEEQHRAAYWPRERYFSDGDVCGPASPVDGYPPHAQIAAVADAKARAATEGLNPKDLVGAVKTPLGLLPWSALVQVAGVFKVGADKYGAYNWRTPGQPIQHVTYVEAAFRHLAAYMDGQTIDPETGCNHLAHAACGLLILLDASAVGNAIDNRPTPGNAAEIMALRREV